MSTINRSALVPYTPEQMFNIVDDIKSYSEFLPWCGASEELSRDGDQVDGKVTISKGAINKAFTTRNFLQQHSQIEMTLLDGPFSKLNGFWRFEDINGEACKISLDLDFEFSNRLVGMAIGSIFNQIANTLVDSYVDRANALYGHSE